ncbi:hypothetical protein [Sphingopyxis granuli]|uniref:hypothetical protein n=1 Tax=Sphingopyxis granuli TaxID=267128 RepID=UPI000A89BEF8|nr:hypothetical protein [Sphingopyxis granuli]
MTNDELRKEVRKQFRLERLGSNHPRCGVCGEGDDRCLEDHHIAGRRWDDATVIICRNCHRKVSDDQKDYPVFNPNADPLLDRIGHFLLGLADMLRLIVEKLVAFGHALIERAAPASVGSKA